MKRFLIKYFLITLVVAVMICMAATGSSADLSIWAPQSLKTLIKESLPNNQDIKSLESQVKSLREEISFAGLLNDPRIGIGLLNIPTDHFGFDQEPMTQKQIFIAQKIPWFGKLSLQSQQAAIKAIRQEAVLKAKQMELAREIATSYYERGFVASSQKVNKKLINMLTQIVRVSETRYASGQGLQQDVLQGQVELSKLLDEQITLAKKHHMLEDQINSLLNRSSFIPVTPPESLPYPDPLPKMEELQTQALKMNPWLKGALPIC
jgi:outer membrane protein, heavy metal efflux system